MTFEFVSGVGLWTGVRWDGNWHLAKEGLGLSVSQAPTAGPQRLEGLTVIDGGTWRECHRDKRERKAAENVEGGREKIRKKDGRGEE